MASSSSEGAVNVRTRVGINSMHSQSLLRKKDWASSSKNRREAIARAGRIQKFKIYTKSSVLARIVPNSRNELTNSKLRETLGLFQTILRVINHDNAVALLQGAHYVKRVDIHIAKVLKDLRKCVNMRHVVGPIDGVHVGLQFRYRAELAVVGLHHRYQAGIDFMKHNGSLIATSIVASGGYDNDLDWADVIEYSGAGGIYSKVKKIYEDQKLKRGNLALKNSISEQNPVRVIRGYNQKISNGREKPRKVKTFTYDGLYLVTDYWKKQGQSGNKVYVFRLKRIIGQPSLDWNSIIYSKKSKDCHGVCTPDISGGKERVPICVVNVVNDQKPPLFEYITNMCYPYSRRLFQPRGCDCVNLCSISANCSCARINGGKFPYDKDGSILVAEPLVYECGISCRCPSSCYNKLSQRGIQIQLEIFQKMTGGWGVRSLKSIPSGRFICEYLGVLLKDEQTGKLTGSEKYLFYMGSNQSSSSLQIGPSEAAFTIDARRCGNISRFINHSSSPNLHAQRVLYAHEVRRPHVLIFAGEDIEALQELTINY